MRTGRPRALPLSHMCLRQVTHNNGLSRACGGRSHTEFATHVYTRARAVRQSWRGGARVPFPEIIFELEHPPTRRASYN